MTNFDWYAPSNAERYTKEEFKKMLKISDFVVSNIHSEEACHSGRFLKI